MLKTVFRKGYNLFLFSAILPFISGCLGGGGGSGAASSGVASNPTISSPDLFLTLPPPSDIVNGTLPFTSETLAKIHNPEPTTLLLLGSGMLMLGYFSKKK